MDDRSTGNQEQCHEIACLRSLSFESAKTLRSHWITSVEQFVATAATNQGRKGLEMLLGGGRDIVDTLLQESRELLGSEHYKALTQARPGGPLGAQFDDTACKKEPDGSKGGAA